MIIIQDLAYEVAEAKCDERHETQQNTKNEKCMQMYGYSFEKIHLWFCYGFCYAASACYTYGFAMGFAIV